MAKVRILNSTPGPITLMAYNNAGQLEMATIAAATNQGPGEGLVDESLLELLAKKDDRAVRAHFEAGRLRAANPNTVEQPNEPVPVPAPTPAPTPEPEVPAADPVPAVPPAPATDDDAVPETTDNTPPDAPWATGNS